MPEDAALLAARLALARVDPALERAHLATPAYAWRWRPGGFSGLFRILVEQQISARAAEAIFLRCAEALKGPSPEAVEAASLQDLRALGLTMRKAGQVKVIAGAVLAGALDFEALKALGPAEAVAALTRLPGVGPWTAEVYLMMAEGREDFCPEGDIALREGLRLAEGAAERPSERAFRERARLWSPFRGHAAHLLWAYYLLQRGGGSKAAP